jgi:hypothetical protein
MSDKSADNAAKVTVLPQFMNEQKHAPIEIEEHQSWLNNNLHKLMIGVSAVWFAIVLIYITQFFGWSNLFLMMPDEFGGFLAGVTLPLAIIWVVMAYIDRGSSFKQEAKFLRAYMNQLVYPEDGAPQTAKAMADAIRSQVVELQQVSKLAHEQTSKIKDAIKENVDDFAQLVGKLDTYSSQTIVELSDGVKFLMSNFDSILNKAQTSTQNLSKINDAFINSGKDIDTSLSDLLNKIIPQMNNLKETAGLLQSITSGSASDMLKTNDNLKTFVANTDASFKEMQAAIQNQMSSLQQVSDTALNNCNMVRTTLSAEVKSMDNVLHDHTEQLKNVVEESGRNLRNQTETATKTALANVGILNNNLQKGLASVDDSVSGQIRKVQDALNKHNQEVLSFIKLLDSKSDDVCDKFSTHSKTIAGELDKLLVRGANLEDSIAMQTANLKGVSEQAIQSMRQVEQSMQDNATRLTQTIATANGDIVTYSGTLDEKAKVFAEISIESTDALVSLSDTLNKRYTDLQKTIATGLNQLRDVDTDLSKTTENLMVHTAESVDKLNNVAAIMQKHTGGLTEASSIVVTQSQISEASLSQQQKQITDTAARVEDIKSELKRQIDELAKASGCLEKDAAITLDLLKSNISKMLQQCNDALNQSKAINDNLVEQANQFDTSTNRTMAKVTQFENVLMKQKQNMETLAQNIENTSDKVETTLDRQTQTLRQTVDNTEAVISKSMADFEAKSRDITELTKLAAGNINDVAAGLDDKVSTLSLMFRQQEADFYEYCNKASEGTDKMSDILQRQMTGIEDRADKLFARLVILEEDTGRRAATLVANSQKAVAELADIEKSLTEQHTQATQMVDSAVERLEKVNTTVKDYIEGFDTSIAKIDGNLAKSLQNMTDSSEKLQSLNQALLKDNETSWQKMVEQTKYMENEGIKLNNQSERIANMLEVQKNNITEVVNNLSTQARLGEASLAQQYKILTDATVETAAKIQEINASFKSNTGQIFDTTNKLSYEFEVLGDRLIKASEGVSKAAKDSIKNMDQTSLRLNQYSEDLNSTIYHSVENIGSVFNEYEKYLAGFNTVTAETSTGVVEINNLISAQSDKMVQISADTKKLVDCFNTVLNDTSNQLADRANDAYDKVKSLGNDLKKLSMEMDEASKLSATHLEKSGDKLRASINEIASNAERISNTILSSGEVFVKQSQALTTLADDTAGKVNRSISELVEAGKIFEAQGQNIVKESIRFNDTVSAQTKSLSETSVKAEQAMKSLSTTYKDIKIDAFLQDAGKIIGTLENVSVDINRLLNPKDEEDLWKKFYNGDTQVFIRSIAKNMNNAQVALLRREFEKNAELRKQVNTYMTAFETLVEKSKNHEHSAALMAVISGADLGRLYYVLAKALNKLN